MHKTSEGWEQSKTLVIFFCPKIDEFCMILCRVTLDDQFQPSISSSSQPGFAQYLFHIIHIDALYLPHNFYCQ